MRVYKSFTRIQSSPEGSTPHDSLKYHINALIDHMVENPVYIQLMLHDFGAIRVTGNLADNVEKQIDTSFQNVQKMLDYGHAAGDFRKAVADTYLAYIFGAGLISLTRNFG